MPYAKRYIIERRVKMSKKTPEVLYNLIPSQQTMYLMFKYTFSKQKTAVAT